MKRATSKAEGHQMLIRDDDRTFGSARVSWVFCCFCLVFGFVSWIEALRTFLTSSRETGLEKTVLMGR